MRYAAPNVVALLRDAFEHEFARSGDRDNALGAAVGAAIAAHLGRDPAVTVAVARMVLDARSRGERRSVLLGASPWSATMPLSATQRMTLRRIKDLTHSGWARIEGPDADDCSKRGWAVSMDGGRFFKLTPAGEAALRDAEAEADREDS